MLNWNIDGTPGARKTMDEHVGQLQSGRYEMTNFLKIWTCEDGDFAGCFSREPEFLPDEQPVCPVQVKIAVGTSPEVVARTLQSLLDTLPQQLQRVVGELGLIFDREDLLMNPLR